MRLLVDDGACGGPRVVHRHLLARHADADLAARHGDDADAPAYAAPGDRPLPARGADEHGRGDDLHAHVAHHGLEQRHVADGPQGLLLAHEEGGRRQARRGVRLLVGARLYPGDAPAQALPAGELALVGRQPGEEPVGALVLALGLGAPGRAQDQAEPGLVGEPPRPLDPAPPAAREGDERRHVVGDEFLGHAAEDPERLEQAREQVVGRPPRGGDEDVPAGVAQRRREHVELEDLAVRVDHPDVLLPVELQLPARRGLEPGVGLGGGGPENQPRPPAPCGEGAVPGERRVVVHMEQELVHRPLRHPGQRRLLRGDVPDALEGALPLRPPIRGVRPLRPVPRDRVPVHAVPPRYVAEVRLRPSSPVHVQLSHDVLLHTRSLRGPALRQERICVCAIGESAFARMAAIR